MSTTPRSFRTQLGDLTARLQGRALALYLLPQGAIGFTRAAG